MAIRICSGVLFGASLFAQTPAPVFEAASLRLNTSGSGYYFNATPGRLEIRDVSLKILIWMAYPAADYSFSGPKWLDSVKLDLVAKFPASEPPSRQMLMLKTLLAERFKLEVRQEVKDIPGYALVIAPGGLKIRHMEGPGNGTNIAFMGHVAGTMPFTQIVESIRSDLRRPVQNMTGLSGYYEFSLTWTPNELAAKNAESGTLDDRGPSIFTALQEQLGLKLESRKVPVKIVVVDHVERVPIEN